MLASASLEDDRALCLQRFSDAEIAQMAKAVFGFGSADAVAPWRKRLAITARR